MAQHQRMEARGQFIIRFISYRVRFFYWSHPLPFCFSLHISLSLCLLPILPTYRFLPPSPVLGWRWVVDFSALSSSRSLRVTVHPRLSKYGAGIRRSMPELRSGAPVAYPAARAYPRARSQHVLSLFSNSGGATYRLGQAWNLSKSFCLRF